MSKYTESDSFTILIICVAIGLFAMYRCQHSENKDKIRDKVETLRGELHERDSILLEICDAMKISLAEEFYDEHGEPYRCKDVYNESEKNLGTPDSINNRSLDYVKGKMESDYDIYIDEIEEKLNDL